MKHYLVGCSGCSGVELSTYIHLSTSACPVLLGEIEIMSTTELGAGIDVIFKKIVS